MTPSASGPTARCSPARPRSAPTRPGALRLAFEEAAGRGSRLVIVQAWAHPELWRPGRAHGADLSVDETAVHDALRNAAAP